MTLLGYADMLKIEQIRKFMLYSSSIFSSLMRFETRIRLKSSSSVCIGFYNWQIQLFIDNHYSLLSLKIRNC